MIIRLRRREASPQVPVKDSMPADVRAAAKNRKLKAGEVLFRLGDKTIGLCEVIAGHVRLARVDRWGTRLPFCVSQGPARRLLRPLCFLRSITVMR